MRLTIIRLELLATALLLGTAGLWSALRGLDVSAALEPAVVPTLVGATCGIALAATLPLITAPWAARILVLRGLKRAWDKLESNLGPGLSIAEVLVLALCSGLGEEVFFRGVVQRELGLGTAAAIFGLLHPLGVAYVVWASTVGAGLGLLYVATGSLLAPVAAHGAYNLVALAYLRRRSNPPEELV
jgi:hypothetical protein